MGFNIARFHLQHRYHIIQQWAERLHTEVGEQYARRSLRELLETVSEALEANHQVLIHGDYRYIDRFIKT